MSESTFQSMEHAFTAGLVLSVLRTGGFKVEPVMVEANHEWNYTPVSTWKDEAGRVWSCTVMPEAADD